MQTVLPADAHAKRLPLSGFVQVGLSDKPDGREARPPLNMEMVLSTPSRGSLTDRLGAPGADLKLAASAGNIPTAEDEERTGASLYSKAT